MPRPLREVADDPRAGRKAQMLARLANAGLPVSDGMVILADESLDALSVSTLGDGPYAVRSSSALEDGAGGSAAGLYDSLIGVGEPGVVDAVRAVRASADDRNVRAYLEARGLEPLPIAVLVQRAVDEHCLGVARTEARGYLVEERDAGTPEWSDSTPLWLERGAKHPVAALVARVEALVPGPIDVEYARTGDRVVLLQARPAVARASSIPTRYPPGRWRLDAEHNPEPISVAQAELVRLVEGRRFGARSRVIDGYLYVREERLGPRGTGDPDALARYHDELEPALRAELGSVEGAPLPRVLDVYRATMRRYAAEVRPALGDARRALDALLRAHLGTGLDEHRRLLGGTGGATSERDAALYELGREPSEPRLDDYLARYGAYAPAWDVEVPCDDEDLARVQAAAARRALGPSPGAQSSVARALADDERRNVQRRLPARVRAAFDEKLDVLRALLTLGENDDLLFFEGQRVVRRALLRRGAELVSKRLLDRADDVFHLRLDATGDLRAEVDAALVARRKAAQRVPPQRIVDGHALVRLPDSGTVLRGRPVGGRARGRAFVVRSLTRPLDDVPDGAVLVLPAALPSLAPHLAHLAALVTEHGGALSHAATLARESGVAAVVGAAGALEIPDGAEVFVDGERGRVLVVGSGVRART